MKWGRHIVKVVLLTVLTQAGGVIYILNRVLLSIFLKKRKFKKLQYSLCFVALYAFFSVTIIPSLAKLNGRVHLPVLKSCLKPQNWFTVLANRHYVSDKMYKVVTGCVGEFVQKTPEEIKVNYLDANFPFWDGFPLIPHLSHNDGHKLDLSLRYKTKSDGVTCNRTPSVWGYGVYEESTELEYNQSIVCKQRNGLYDVTKYLGWRLDGETLEFDAGETKRLMQILIGSEVEKIFIEPHLKQRLNLTSKKVRFHGCHAVRHDDHIHVQVD